MEINIKTPDQTESKSFFQSSTAKMIMVGILTLVLLIPLFFVQDLITERSIRQKEVVTETTSKWGGGVYVYGPILKIPYKNPVTGKSNFAYFFPEKLNNSVTTTMEKPLFATKLSNAKYSRSKCVLESSENYYSNYQFKKFER